MIEINDGYRNFYLERTPIQNLFKKCKDIQRINNQLFEYRIIGRSYANSVIKLLTHHKIKSELNQIIKSIKTILSIDIIKAIQNHTAVAYIDVSTK